MRTKATRSRCARFIFACSLKTKAVNCSDVGSCVPSRRRIASGAGLIASGFHLGRPERALRAFSQWRSSWLSREAWATVAALLASVLPSPDRFSPARPSSYLRQRAQWVQTQMRQLGPNHIEWH
ncbi:MAG: hypothetical protein CVV45_19805 [Spirochaetae bacterium HGW-Spirochaetae-10]|nr:MAG: hypothetical protein CVV45_19805 [Spirochaetae bacterium HGW-Spirochaetae-10]